MKSLSTSTRCGVRRPAGKELALLQQAPEELHVETWEVLLQGPDLRMSQEVEIAPRCAVLAACPSCPDDSLVSLGPGRVIRNMLGWSLEEETDRVWGYGCSVVAFKR